jgi:hypothetical protein
MNNKPKNKERINTLSYNNESQRHGYLTLETRLGKLVPVEIYYDQEIHYRG